MSYLQACVFSKLFLQVSSGDTVVSITFIFNNTFNSEVLWVVLHRLNYPNLFLNLDKFLFKPNSCILLTNYNALNASRKLFLIQFNRWWFHLPSSSTLFKRNFKNHNYLAILVPSQFMTRKKIESSLHVYIQKP